jgi:signal transduction histidine kinase
MTEIYQHLEIILIYFIYGLGFLAMGMAMALEIVRSSSIINTKMLIPLAGFGLVHGIHEWLEIFLMQLTWGGYEFPVWLSIFRLSLLAISFILLMIFGLLTRRSYDKTTKRNNFTGYVLMGIYISVILLSAFAAVKIETLSILLLTDVLIRYLIAVPGAIFACLGLYSQSREFRSEGRLVLSRSVFMAANGFGLYGLTQIFVPAINMFPARWINAETFNAAIGFPIQVIRAITSIVILIGMIRALILVEQERKTLFANTQQARMDALEQIQVELTEREILRRELLRHTVHAQEDERSRIARELHDETSQVLSAFTLDLATLRQISSRRKDITMLVDRLQNLGKQMSQGIFRMVHDLRPAQLDDLGLASALNYLTERENCPPGLKVTLEVKGQERRLDPIVETVFFRVAQEALTNICRHARVTDAIMRILYEENQVTLWIEDKGIGFNPKDNFSPPRGWGLAGMQERVDSVDGTLSITSTPGKGTIIEVIIPSEMEGNNTKENLHGSNSFDAG